MDDEQWSWVRMLASDWVVIILVILLILLFGAGGFVVGFAAGRVG